MRNLFSSDSSDAYSSILENLKEIEHALDHHDSAPFRRFAQDLDLLLEKVQFMDSQQTSPPSNTHRLVIEKILKKNTAIMARIEEIMALQRIELTQIKQGRETAKGYASYRSTRTGSIINSAN